MNRRFWSLLSIVLLAVYLACLSSVRAQDDGQDACRSGTVPDAANPELCVMPTDDSGSDAPVERVEPGDGEVEGDEGEAGSSFGGGSEDPAEAASPASIDAGTPETIDGAASLSIQHWECPGPVNGVSADDLVATCTASLAPSTWELNGEAFEVPDGYAVWDGLAPDTVTIRNGAAVADTESAVHCSLAVVTDQFIFGFEVPARDGAIVLIFDQPSIVYCNWFVGQG